jgi:hypothetical protein
MTIYIHCGIKDYDTEGQNLFWPVLKAIPLAYSWSPDKNKKFSLVFTSKIAVKIVFKMDPVVSAKASPRDDREKFPEGFPWNGKGILRNNCEHICAVGRSTAELLKLILTSWQKPILYPQEEGLFNLLTETSFTAESIVYIFTALNGKTAETLDSRACENDNLRRSENNNRDFVACPVPVYKLVLFQSQDNFLKQLFLEPDKKYIFCCRSAQVLRAAVTLLQNFFSCSEPKNLPKNVFFRGEKQSVQNEIQSLDLIDRILS